MKEKVDLPTDAPVTSELVAEGGGERFLVVGVGATLAFSFAAPGRTAEEVPGLLDADIKPENGLGTGFDGTAVAVASFGATAGAVLKVPLAKVPTVLGFGATDSSFFRSAFCKASGFEACLMIVGTTVRFVAGKVLPSVSRGRLRPAASDGFWSFDGIWDPPPSGLAELAAFFLEAEAA